MIPRMNCARVLSVILVLATTPTALFPQRAARPPHRQLQKLEADIRAELGFLASDAMQGRGSGTGFERIAAEYIGSQFREFGLEPGGDSDNAGNKGFVQKVVLESVRFTAPPVLTITSGNESHNWHFGSDLLVSFLRVPKVRGELQVIEADGTPAKGAIVAVRMSDDTDPQKRQEILRKARSIHAAGVVMPESEANRRIREAGNVKLPALPGRLRGDPTDNGFVAISLRREAFDEIAAMPAGARVDFGGPIQPNEPGTTWNAVGVLRGSDAQAAKEVIMLSAHLDHLGVNQAGGADTIFNGADDDASGCVAVLELARALASGPRPRRTVYFVCFGSEERGGYGARYFIAHSPVPLPEIVADVNLEMLGRPDAKVKPNTLWLTGYERSNLGPELARHGASIVPDPHPEQNFFQRSDNYTLAVRGVVAHTVSSFGLHTDYHQPTDDLTRIDFQFMTRSIRSLMRPIRWLANSRFRPAWLPGQAPTR